MVCIILLFFFLLDIFGYIFYYEYFEFSHYNNEIFNLIYILTFAFLDNS